MGIVLSAFRQFNNVGNDQLSAVTLLTESGEKPATIPNTKVKSKIAGHIVNKRLNETIRTS